MGLKTRNNLLEQQQSLQEEANKILAELDLIELLKTCGSPKIIGSMFLGLMTWKDIDIEVVTQTLSKEDVSKIVAKLINNSAKRIDITVLDNTAHDKPGYPQGIYLGI